MSQVEWVKDWDMAFGLAQKSGKPVFVDFFKPE